MKKTFAINKLILKYIRVKISIDINPFKDF